MTTELPMKDEVSTDYIQQMPEKIKRDILHRTLKGPNSIISGREVCYEWYKIITKFLNLTLTVHRDVYNTGLLVYRFKSAKTAFDINELSNSNQFDICSAIHTVEIQLQCHDTFNSSSPILNTLNGKTSSNCNLILLLSLAFSDDTEQSDNFLITTTMREEFSSFWLRSLNIDRCGSPDKNFLRYILSGQSKLDMLQITHAVQFSDFGNTFDSVRNLRSLNLDFEDLGNNHSFATLQLPKEIVMQFPFLEECLIERINCNILSNISTFSTSINLTILSIDGYIQQGQLFASVDLSSKYLMPSIKEFSIRFLGLNNGSPQSVPFPDRFMQSICLISMPNLTNFKFNMFNNITLDIVSLHELDASKNGRKLLSVMNEFAFTLPGFENAEERHEYDNALKSLLSHCPALETFNFKFTDYGFERRIFNYLPESVVNCTIDSKNSTYSLITVNPFEKQPLNTNQTNAWLQSINELSNKKFKLSLSIQSGKRIDQEFRSRVLNQLSDIIQPNLVSIIIRNGNHNFIYECVCDVNWIIEGKERQLYLTIQAVSVGSDDSSDSD